MKRKDNLKYSARALRNSATKEENKLWYQYLKNQKLQWYRQRVIGDYITDFYCRKIKLVIELDGSQHFQEENMKYDVIRTEYLNSMGIEVIRFTNTEVNLNFEGVCKKIELISEKREKEVLCKS